MTEQDSGWSQYKMHVIETLRRIEDAQESQNRRLDAMERLLSEVRGAWRVAVFVAGVVGALLSRLVSKVVSI